MRAMTPRMRMSDPAIEATGELGRQADHHRHGLPLSGVAAGDDVVVGRARLALVSAVAAELAAEARHRKAAVGRPVVGEGAIADPLATRIVDAEGDRAVAAKQGAIAGKA